MAPSRPHGAMPVEGGMTPSAQSDGVRAETRQPVAGVLDELSGALASARAALLYFLDLMSLEARRAGLALMWMVAWGFVAAKSCADTEQLRGHLHTDCALPGQADLGMDPVRPIALAASQLREGSSKNSGETASVRMTRRLTL